MAQTAIMRQKLADEHEEEIARIDAARMQAAKYFRLAADQGIAGAQGELGLMYYTGQGVRQNRQEGIRYLRLAAQQGMEETQDFFAKIG